MNGLSFTNAIPVVSEAFKLRESPPSPRASYTVARIEARSTLVWSH